MTGRRIDSVGIETKAPPPLPGLAGIAGKVHVTTRKFVIRRDLLFSSGDTVDTTRVAESIRRLRHRPYLAHAVIEGHSCGAGQPVTLIVRTEDRWTTKPNLTVQSTSSFIGIQEDDLFGTGRSGSLSFALREGRAGIAAGYEDFWFFGQSLSAKLRGALYADGNYFRGRFRNQEQSVYDKWRSQLIVSQYMRDSRDTPDKLFQSFERRTALAFVGRRISATPMHVDDILFGAEAERAELNAPDRAMLVGPHLAKRRYAGGKIGLARRAAAFDTLTWLIEKQILIDVPRGSEWEVFAGAGHDAVTKEPGLFLNGWAGHMWSPDERTLSQIDLWGSGYRIAHRGNWDDASVRGAFSSYRRTLNGVFSGYLLAEKLVNPDPDVRALSNLDITSYAIKRAYRFAEEAYAGGVQQSVHIHDLSKSVALDGAFFTAASLRRKSPFSQSDHVTVAVIGAGLRLVPTTPGSGALRLDVMYPVAGSRGAENHAVIALSLSPWLEASRHREDPRLRQ